MVDYASTACEYLRSPLLAVTTVHHLRPPPVSTYQYLLQTREKLNRNKLFDLSSDKLLLASTFFFKERIPPLPAETNEFDSLVEKGHLCFERHLKVASNLQALDKGVKEVDLHLLVIDKATTTTTTTTATVNTIAATIASPVTTAAMPEWLGECRQTSGAKGDDEGPPASAKPVFTVRLRRPCHSRTR